MVNTIFKEPQKIFTKAKEYTFQMIFVKMMYFIASILVSGGTIFGRYSPFGISFTAAAPYKNLAFTAIGAAIGYLFQIKVSMGIRYISAVLAIAVVRWALNDLVKIRKHILYAPIIVFSSTFITGMAALTPGGLDFHDVSLCLLEATVAASAAFFFDKTFKIFTEKKSSRLNQKEFVCVIMSLSILALSLSNLTFGGVSIGRTLAIAMILISSYIIGVQGGSIAGVAAGTIFTLPSFGITFISGAYAFGGMISGFFTKWGKIGVCISFALTCSIISFQSGDSSLMIKNLYEVILGITLFLVIPKAMMAKIRSFLPTNLTETKTDGIKDAAVQRLNLASKSLLNVSGFVQEVSEKISKITEPKFNDMCAKSIGATCNRCGLRMLCWEKEYTSTQNNIDRLTDMLSRGNKPTKATFSEDFLKRCSKNTDILNNLDKDYKEFLAQQAANKRAKEMQKVVTEQFGGVSALLSDLAEEFTTCEVFDSELSEKFKQKLEFLNIKNVNVTCHETADGYLTIEIETDKFGTEKINSKIIKELSKICGKILEKPVTNKIGEKFCIKITEKTRFEIDFAISQHACNNGLFCGDNICAFNNGDGNFIAIISDGMGTGGKAAVEGAMTAELMGNLIKSGMSFGSAVRLVNSALLVKAGDESLSTVDVLKFNLFNGNASFMKAGAPATYIKKDNKIEKIDFSSLPIGILNEVTFESENKNFERGDLILLLSDGATDIGDEWILNIMQNYNEENIEKLANLIVSEAVNLRQKTHDDDITAMVIRVE